MLTLPNAPTIPVGMSTDLRESGHAFASPHCSWWDYDRLTAAGTSALYKATFEAGIEALRESKSQLDSNEQALIFYVLVSNYLTSQVASEVGKGLLSVLRPENLIRSK